MKIIRFILNCVWEGVWRICAVTAVPVLGLCLYQAGIFGVLTIAWTVILWIKYVVMKDNPTPPKRTLEDILDEYN